MSFFSRKQEITLEAFCSDFYGTQLLAQSIGNVDFGGIYSEVVKNSIVEVYPDYSKIDAGKLDEEIKVLRFELFALAWTHKFLSGKIVVAQSCHTKSYLHERGRDDIWARMKPYNDAIDGVTLHWLGSLGKGSLSFNYAAREGLTKKNIEAAEKLGIENDDVVVRVNQRLWSEPAWTQKLMLGPLVFVFCEQTGVDSNDLPREAQLRLAVMIKGLYEGAKQSWEKVKIKL